MSRNRSRWIAAALLLLALSSAPAQVSDQIQQKLTLREFVNQAEELIKRIHLLSDHFAGSREVRDSVPETVTVIAGSREYIVSYAWLKNDLAEFPGADPAKRSQLIKDIESRLQQAEEEALMFTIARPVPQNASAKLDGILSRREFADVHGPTALDRLRDRVLRWLARLLERIFVRAGSHSQMLQIVSYIFMGAAVVVLVLWIKRHFSAPPATNSAREILPFAPSARHWRSWLNQARQLAAQGDWRGAIHLAYWAAISFLEEGGAWRPDRARTPREYLKLIGQQNHHFSILRELTQMFELTWYGNQEANAVHFQETLSHLEKLGCR
jgi:uncharacterized protein DUF4129